MSDYLWDELLAAHKQANHRGDGQFPDHLPKAAVLACSDARVPPTQLFNQKAGSLFVVRIAGNTASPAAQASLDYAVAQLATDLVFVLGHTGCGAVQAASSGPSDPYLEPVVAPIRKLAAANPAANAEELVALNVAHTLYTLFSHDGPTGNAARAGSIQLRGAVHDLRAGVLLPIDVPSISLIPTSMENP